MLAVVREALSNVVQHARATRVRITVHTEAGMLTISMSDNGVGPGEAIARGGLTNMRHRAQGHGGTFELSPTDPTGTTIVWSVPV